jgi:hypothetical protein
MTLARFFIKLRNDAGLSLRDAARKARPKLDPSTLWKIENARPVRAATLGQALRALGLQENDDDYVRALSLWSMEQSQTLGLDAVDRDLSRARSANGRAFNQTLARAAAALRKIPEADWPIIVEALEHADALKLWVQSARLVQK